MPPSPGDRVAPDGKGRRTVRRVLIALGTLLMVLGASVSIASASEVCSGLDSGKIDVSGDRGSVTITAPDGKLIDGYCVSAGSSKQGDGPEYHDVDPPQQTIVITHSSGKGVSHWSVSYVDDPSTTTTQPGGTTTTTDVSGTTITSTSTTTSDPSSTTTSDASTSTTDPSGTTTTSGQGGGGGGGTVGGTTVETLPLTGIGDFIGAIGFMGGSLMALGVAVMVAAAFARPRNVLAGASTREIWVAVHPNPGRTIHLKLHRIAGTG